MTGDAAACLCYTLHLNLFFFLHVYNFFIMIRACCEFLKCLAHRTAGRFHQAPENTDADLLKHLSDLHLSARICCCLVTFRGRTGFKHVFACQRICYEMHWFLWFQIKDSVLPKCEGDDLRRLAVEIEKLTFFQKQAKTFRFVMSWRGLKYEKKILTWLILHIVMHIDRWATIWNQFEYFFSYG